MTDPRHLDVIVIEPARLARWLDCASRLGGNALQAELADFARDPTRHRLELAARAARWVEQHTSGTEAMIANAIATELEDAAS